MIFGAKTPFIDNLVRQLNEEFEVTDLGDATWILGLQITYSEQGITISQRSYIDKILAKFGMDRSRPASTPLDRNHKLQKGTIEEQIDDPSYYQCIIGSLMYTVTGSRPDLAYAVTFLPNLTPVPTSHTFKQQNEFCGYLNGTKDQVLYYPANRPLVLEGYSDASHGNDLDNRRSVSGYLFKCGDSAISWKSSKQKSVAISTTEAEYMAMSLTACQLIWLKQAAKDLRLPMQLALHCDNTGSIDLAHNPKLNE